jgi:hypothetical protein
MWCEVSVALFAFPILWSALADKGLLCIQRRHTSKVLSVQHAHSPRLCSGMLTEQVGVFSTTVYVAVCQFFDGVQLHTGATN